MNESTYQEGLPTHLTRDFSTYGRSEKKASGMVSILDKVYENNGLISNAYDLKTMRVPISPVIEIDFEL